MIEHLYEFAQAEFRLDKRPDNSKATQREHLQVIEQQLGITPEELNNPPLNIAVGYLLEYFYAVSSSRQCGMSANPITFSEILAWSQLTNTSLARWEIEVIKRLDILWLNIQAE
ncbi:phage tail assembly chaperone [Haemophilus seminalis]|uniref:phage tail assembly chaperone n=1 Tax=Haemophilus TaxID=724 RepID=UPI003B00C460